MEEKLIMFEKYLKEEERAENTIEKYVRDIKEFNNWLIAEPKNKEMGVTKAILLNYKEYLKKSNLKISSINSKISSLNAYLKYNNQESLILKLIKNQKLLFGSKEKELTKYEFNKLYEVSKTNKRLMLLIETIAKTGIRVSEVKYITVESLDMGKAIVNNKGKCRIILIPQKLCLKLKEYAKYCRGEAVRARCRDNIKNCNGEVLPSLNLNNSIFLTKNGKPLDRKQIWQMMKNLAKNAGIPKEKVFPHNFRHFFAREFYKQTHDIIKLSSILGHNCIETTRIYTVETEDECRKHIEKLLILKE